jgi:hypothetical protein
VRGVIPLVLDSACILTLPYRVLYPLCVCVCVCVCVCAFLVVLNRMIIFCQGHGGVDDSLKATGYYVIIPTGFNIKILCFLQFNPVHTNEYVRCHQFSI